MKSKAKRPPETECRTDGAPTKKKAKLPEDNQDRQRRAAILASDLNKEQSNKSSTGGKGGKFPKNKQRKERLKLQKALEERQQQKEHVARTQSKSNQVSMDKVDVTLNEDDSVDEVEEDQDIQSQQEEVPVQGQLGDQEGIEQDSAEELEEVEEEPVHVNTFLTIKGRKHDAKGRQHFKLSSVRFKVLRDQYESVFGIAPVFGDGEERKLSPNFNDKFGMEILYNDDGMVGFYVAAEDDYDYEGNKVWIEDFCQQLETVDFPTVEDGEIEEEDGEGKQSCTIIHQEN